MEYKTTLTIADPPQYGVIVEKFGQKEDAEKSLFYEVYKDALNNVGDICDANVKGSNEEMLNTVIAFVGQRGSGKSTAMYSFSSFLKDGDLSSFFGCIDEEKKNSIQKASFRVLSPIDSAQLGVKETIIGRISAAMRSEYENEVKKSGCSISTEKKREFIKTLTEVNKYAVSYQTGEWFHSDEKLLDNTYHISMLRNNMCELVQTYLKFISGKDKVQDEYLVISVDDLDMGIENSYAIMEEIRKFLCIKNTIVLITLRMDQVHLSLKAKFKKQLDMKIDDEEDDALIDDLAYRYAEKLFPYDRQHQMPVLSAKNLKEWKANFAGVSNLENAFIRDAVLNLIWQKTRIILVPNKDEEHLLIPHNLRSLCNFVVFLRGLKKVEKDGEEIDKPVLSNNIEEFAQYLVSNIRTFEHLHIHKVDQKLADVLVKIIHSMRDVPLKRINAYIVGTILYHLQQSNSNDTSNNYYSIFNFTPYNNAQDKQREKDIPETNTDPETKNELEILLDACMHPECISIGDLMYVLGKIDSKTRCRYIKYLVEVIRTLWSAKMTNERFTKDKNNLIGKRIDYTDAIGSLIVNPDVGFWGDNSDFEVIENINPKLDNRCVYVTSESAGTQFYYFKEWRSKFSMKSSEEVSNGWCHPFKPFTSKDGICVFPFCSFDIIYRFYEELHEELHEELSVESNKCMDFDVKSLYLFKKFYNWFDEKNGTFIKSFANDGNSESTNLNSMIAGYKIEEKSLFTFVSDIYKERIKLIPDEMEKCRSKLEDLKSKIAENGINEESLCSTVSGIYDEREKLKIKKCRSIFEDLKSQSEEKKLSELLSIIEELLNYLDSTPAYIKEYPAIKDVISNLKEYKRFLSGDESTKPGITLCSCIENIYEITTTMIEKELLSHVN